MRHYGKLSTGHTTLCKRLHWCGTAAAPAQHARVKGVARGNTRRADFHGCALPFSRQGAGTGTDGSGDEGRKRGRRKNTKQGQTLVKVSEITPSLIFAPVFPRSCPGFAPVADGPQSRANAGLLDFCPGAPVFSWESGRQIARSGPFRPQKRGLGPREKSAGSGLAMRSCRGTGSRQLRCVAGPSNRPMPASCLPVA